MDFIFHELLEENSTTSSWKMKSIRQRKLSISLKKLQKYDVIHLEAFTIGFPIVILRCHSWRLYQYFRQGVASVFKRTVLENYFELGGPLEILYWPRPLLNSCSSRNRLRSIRRPQTGARACCKLIGFVSKHRFL